MHLYIEVFMLLFALAGIWWVWFIPKFITMHPERVERYTNVGFWLAAGQMFLAVVQHEFTRVDHPELHRSVWYAHWTGWACVAIGMLLLAGPWWKNPLRRFFARRFAT